jgi:hypothetical protein
MSPSPALEIWNVADAGTDRDARGDIDLLNLVG